MSALKSGLLNVLARNGLDDDLINKAAQIIDSYVPQNTGFKENLILPSRYEDVGLVKSDAITETRYVRDKQLRRIVIMKIGGRLTSAATKKELFINQIKQIAQLEHPNIVPVHDIGELENGRPFYTMRLSSGLTLKAAIERMKQAKSNEDDWNFRHLIDSYRKVLLAVSYADSMTVYHDELTADNVLLGEFGEVLVTNWMQLTADENTRASRFSCSKSNVVAVLGWMLFNILNGNEKIDKAIDSPQDVQRVLNQGSSASPQQLIDLCHEACNNNLKSHSDLLSGIDSWLEGIQKKDKANQLVEEADKLGVLKAQLLTHSKQAKEEAESNLLQISYHAPEEEKYDGWRQLDEAQKTLEMVEMLEQEQLKNLNGSISYHAENPKAHLSLSKVYWERVQRRKNDGDTTQRIRDESRLLQAVQRLREDHPERKRIEEFLEGTATLTLHTSSPGAKVYRKRYEDDGIILQASRERYLGTTPLINVELMPGSYLLIIRKEGYEDVTYPICLKKGESWDSCPPGESTPNPVWLPPKGSIPDGFCYVPAGWTIIGGDTNPDSRGNARQRVWVDDFAIARHHVSNKDYIEFLNDLVDRGDVEKAERCAPFDMFKMIHDHSKFHQGSDKRFSLNNPETGSKMHPGNGVGNTDTQSMADYIDWVNEKTGKQFRFVRFDEWEKAARGVDERIFPWGNHCDPAIVNFNLSLKGEQKIAPPEAYPLDVSPYGVRFMAGNLADLVDSVFDRKPTVVNGRFVYNPLDYKDPNAIHLLRGNGCFGNQSCCRVTNFYYMPNGYRMSPKGFRLCLSLSKQT